jgi:DNA-binding transcriptional MerR regulator
MFKYNEKVRVKNPKLKTYNLIGVVNNSGYDGCYVRLENGSYLYCQNKNLESYKENQEEQKMAITGDFKVAKVKFLEGSNTNTAYEYALFDDYDVGTYVVVKSAHHGFGVAKIVEIISKEQATTKKFEREIVTAFDMETYETRKKNRAKIQELNNRMDKRFQELNKLALFEMMAEKDAELKGMLDEYKSLMGV